MLPLGNIQLSLVTVNSTAADICVASSSREEINFNDVLETIELLLHYIKKRAKNKDKNTENDFEFDLYASCAICTILKFKFSQKSKTGERRSVILYLSKKLRQVRKYLAGRFVLA